MRLVLADDHALFLEALAEGMVHRGHEVVGLTDRLEGLVELVERHQPDLCVFDVDFGGRSVSATIEEIRAGAPDLPIVLLTGATAAEARQVFDAGRVEGVVSKLCDVSTLDRVIRQVRAGDRVLEHFERAAGSAEATARSVRTPALTRQEQRVVALLARGASTEQIARELGVSGHTVRSHVRGILLKLGVNSRAKAATVGSAMGLESTVDRRQVG